MPRYSDDFRAKAVAALKLAGFPDKHGALITVADTYNVPVFTLRRWFRGEFNPPPDNLVSEQLRDMRTLLLDEMYTVIRALPEKRHDASYRQLALSLSTYLDKMPMLNEMPPKLMDVLPLIRDILTEVESLKWDPEEFFESMVDELHREAERRATSQSVHANIDPNDLIRDSA
ncbi:MAG: hypothetical protein KF716_00095 [Anaerolineae bacterium]|nr:hypothetical protein [Anaerolineae bacterium]